MSGKRAYKDFAILYRTNAQSRHFEDVLNSKRTPYQVIGSLRFYDRKEIKDAIAYLRICVNPQDDLALTRIIDQPPRGIGKSTLDKIVVWGRENDENLAEALKRADEVEGVAKRSVNACKAFGKLIDSWVQSLATEKPGVWAQKVLDESGYLSRLENDDSFEARGRLENLDELLNSIIRAEEDGRTLQEYLEDVALVADVDKYDPSDDSVRLMTIHSAKGLEFPVVFVVGLEQGLFPLEMGNDEDRNLDEERRLFYVAVTRAREELYLTYANRRMRHGKTNTMYPSKFVREIPKDRIAWAGIDSAAMPLFGGSGTFFERHSSSITEKKQPASIAAKRRNEQKKSDELIAVRVNDLVEHQQFGGGIVIECTPVNNDLKVKVEFNDGSVRTFLQSFAKLQPVKDLT